MDDNVPDGNPPKDFNKIDLTQLQGFSFGTQWTQDKSSPSDKGERGEHPRREGRADGPGGAPDRRDRRTFRRPSPGPESPGAGQPQGGYGANESPSSRAQDQPGGRPPAGSRYSAPGGERRQRFAGRNEPFERRPPYESPYFAVTFYPEDASFAALVKTVRASCRTIELFEIARTVLGKPERFIVSVSPRQHPAGAEQAPAGAGQAGGAQPAPTAEKQQSVYICVPDGLPFETEEAAIAHGLKTHLGHFFDTADVEVDPPKGNFQVINRCGITGELLGPPNYHRYALAMQQHFSAKIGRMSLEEYRTRIESVRDPLVVQQWLDKMKKVTRYTWKAPVEVPSGGSKEDAAKTRADGPQTAPVVQGEPVPESAPVIPEEAAAAVAPSPQPGAEPSGEAPPPAAEPAKDPAPAASSFDSLEEARQYLLTQARGRLVRQLGSVRIHGRALDGLPPGEIRRAIEGEYERQTRFPLDTANALRGRLRREHFTIFKKGAKGVSYVCAVKRKFRVPGQTFSESIGGIISFVETHPMVRAGELLRQYLGIPSPGEPGPSEVAALPELTAEQREKMLRVQADLVWLVREGYVTEFIDGSLYASPPLVEARRKEVEAGEADPENFPEVPGIQEETAAEPAPVQAAEEPAASEEAAPPAAEAPAPAADTSPPVEPPASPA